MAKEIQSKKRKASVPESGAEKLKTKKVKKSQVAEVPTEKNKAEDEPAELEVTKSKTVTKSGAQGTPKSKTTTSEKSERKPNGDSITTKATKKVTSISKKGNTKSKAHDSETQDLNVDVDNSDEEQDIDNASEVDDQTEVLLQGFESEGDDDDNKEEGGLEPGQEVPKVELNKKQKKKLQKALEAADSDKPGVVYVGRIPHGFYEHEMKEYFKQFGTILKLRLSRNPKSGASKHYAFIQFQSTEVAEIVSKTMDNYLLFGHLLKVKVVPDEQVPKDLFKGANKRFKKVPWNKIEGRKLKQGTSEEEWERRIGAEEKRRQDKAEKLKEIGYEFEAPKIKSAKGVAKKHVEAPAAIENGENNTKTTEDTPAVEDSSKAKKKGKKATSATEEPALTKKGKKSNVEAADAVAKEASVPPIVEKAEKPKKEKKRKISEDAEVVTSTVSEKKQKVTKAKSGDDVVVEEKVTKVKKSKKPKAI